MHRNLYIKRIIHVFLLINGMFWGSVANASNSDSLETDTTKINPTVIDSLKPPTNSDALESKVEYLAVDSMRFDIPNQKVYLFGEAEVKYEGIELRANYIELSLDSKEVLAMGTIDSAGKLVGKPEFVDGGQTFNSETMRYNFETKKGKIIQAITQEGDGYIHGKQIKMINDEVIFIKNGKYTTCSNEIPHFHIEASKLKFIKDDKIVSGPAYLKIQNIPTPLALPFGFFPNKSERTSGLIIPTYGGSPGLGFFLNEGGYYLAINDFLDVALMGDIYSRGSWGLGLESNYRKRYKFNGYVDLSYSQILQGEKDITRSKTSNYFIRWRHKQDPKARPNSNFSADVNFGSSKNFQNNFNSTTQDFLTNTFKSNVSYNKSFAGKPFNLTLNGSHSQNSKDSSVTVVLPSATFTMSRIYPLKRTVKVGKDRWYEKIGVNATAIMKNQVKTSEDTLTNYTADMVDLMQNGARVTAPISTSFKVLKYFSISPSINNSVVMYLQTQAQDWVLSEDTNDTGELLGTNTGSLAKSKNEGFAAAYEGSFSTSVNTTIYGTFNYKLKRLKAIRHVMYPSATFNIKPDYSDDFWGYYNSYTKVLDTETTEVDYSRFSGQVYGGPGSGSESGTLGLSLRNTLDAKIIGMKDTTNIPKKVKLLDNLNFSTSYNIFADSLNWNPVRAYAKSRINNNMDVQINSVFDPYAYVIENETGTRINKSYFSEYGGLANMTSFDLVLTFRLKSKVTDDTKKQKEAKEELNIDGDQFVDFNAPWTLNVSYRYNYKKPYQTETITNTLNFSGDVRITTKWKVGFRSGYDIELKKFNYTSLDIYRDLHCWELSFNIVPFGTRKSYTVDLRVKAPVLSDLKLSRKRNWYDFDN
ncbi:MAG: LPS-assembly protein LptD [Flavobacteriales bacterium]|nr:LPS-assembly protein LptD [Flavobacteriales bacterium]